MIIGTAPCRQVLIGRRSRRSRKRLALDLSTQPQRVSYRQQRSAQPEARARRAADTVSRVSMARTPSRGVRRRERLRSSRAVQYGTNTASASCAAVASRAISLSDPQELLMKIARPRHRARPVARPGAQPPRPSGTCRPPIPPTNFHTENIVQFVADVDKATGGKLKITVHANASLFKANEIKRAVQGNQAQAGEILLVNFENEDPLFGIDGVPFLATSYGDAMKLYKARARRWRTARQAGHQAALHRAVAAAGHLCQQDAQQRRRHEGPQVARLQPGDLAHRRTGRRAAGDRAGRGSSRRRSPPASSTRTSRRPRPASTPRPTRASRTSTTRRPGCRRMR